MENIRKSFTLNGKEVPILKGISLFVGAGEFVSIMGPSGSGKSTLSAILGCLSTPSQGTYKINGQDVTKLASSKIARLRNSAIGFIFQDFNLLSGLSALENVALPLVYGGVSGRERKRRAMECLAAVGLTEKAHNKPNQLSGGQKQRVAIARALVNQPSFLFADEPTGALDKKTGQEILGIMQRLNMQGHTVIQVTHSPSDAAYSKRILHLVDGNIVRDETVENPTIGLLSTPGREKHDEVVSKIWRVAQYAPTGSLEDLAAIKDLIEMSHSRDAQLAASRAIVRWNHKDAEDIIEALFSSSDWVVRSEILKYSNLRTREKALPYYLRGIRDPNAWVRHSAMSELKEIEQNELDDSQQQQVLKCLEDKDERVRASAVFVVGKWKVKDIKTFLKRALHDVDGRVRANAVEATKEQRLDSELVDDLIQLLGDRNNRVRANAAMILSRTRKSEALDTAKQMLASQDALTRSSGAWLLGMIKPDNSGLLLLDLMNSEKEEIVVNQIVRSLAKIARDQLPLHAQIEKVFNLKRSA